MADGLDISMLQPSQPLPQGLDLGSALAPTPQGLDLTTIQPNPNLDTPDTESEQLAKSGMKVGLVQLFPSVLPLKHMASGALGSIGRTLQGVSTLSQEPGMEALPFMSGISSAERYDGAKLKSLGSSLVGLAGKDEKMPQENWLTYDLPQGVGNVAAYMGAGLAGGVGAAGAMGALDQGQSMYNDAKESGATEDDAQLAFGAGNLIGSADALPLGRFLRKINEATGGRFWAAAKNVMSNPSALGEVIKGFALEGGTEAAQQLAENWVAKDVLAYDPHRTLDENFWSSFATGGVIGGALGGAVGHLNNAAQREEVAKREADRQSRLASGDPINDLAGQFTPLGDLPDLNTALATLTEDLKARGQQEETAQKQEGNDAWPKKDFISEAASGMNYTGTKVEGRNSTQWERDIQKLIPNPTVEKLLANEKGEMPTMEEALTKTPVVASSSDPYVIQKTIVDKKIVEAKKRIADGSVDPMHVLDLELFEKQREALDEKTVYTQTWLRHMKDYAATFREKLGLKTLLVLNDFSNTHLEHRATRLGGTTNGLMGLSRGAMTVDGKLQDVAMISMDLDRVATARYNEAKLGKGWYSTQETRDARKMMFEVLNHELGHLFVVDKLNEVLTKAMNFDADGINTYNAIAGDYRRWLVQIQTSTYAHYLDHVSPPQMAAEETIAPDRPPKFSPDMRNYAYSFDEYFAQQMARLATQGKLAAEGIHTKFFKTALKEYEEMFKALPAFAKQEYSGGFETFIKQQSVMAQVAEEIEKNQAGGPKSIVDALKKLPGFDPENFAGLQEHLDQWNLIREYGYNLLQAAKDNPHIEGLQKYTQNVRSWAAYSRSIDARAVDTIKDWRHLAKEKMEAITSVLFEETSTNKLLDPKELSKRLPELEQQKVYAQIRADLNWVLKEMEAESLAQARANFIDNETMRNTAIAEIQAEYKKMREKGYFPYIRFGKWINTVRANGDITLDGVVYKDKELISFEAYESKKARNRAMDIMRKKHGGQVLISPSIMKETSFAVQGLPAAMLRTMKERIPNLDADQRSAIDQALQDLAPFKGLQKQFLRRRGVQGFSMDAMRSYAQYMRMAAGHLSRVRYSDPMQQAIQGVNQDVKVLGMLGKDSTKRQQIGNWMDKHFAYVMNPVNEWQALRSMAFMYYLGFNVKSAAINLTQVPMVTYPYLAARYGDVKASAAILRANTSAVSIWKDRTKWINGSQTRQDVIALLEQGKKDGWLDQALATELAIAASEGTVDRALPIDAAKRFWYKSAEWGAKPFQLAEKLNRTVTAIATYQLSRDAGMAHTTAYAAARDAVDATQYENSRWNRPRMMRGKLGSVFIFQSYVQNTLHFVLKDPGASRAVLLMALAAGLFGLPGADDLEELVDFVATRVNRFLGARSPQVQIRQELREHLEELHMNPDLILHGLGQSSFGLPMLGQMVGFPVPEFDVSGSLGLGQVVPGAEILRAAGQSYNDAVAQSVTSLGGAGATMFDNWFRAIWSDDPDNWKRMEKLLPVFAKNVDKSVRYAVRGQEETARGDPVASFDPYDPKDTMELFGQSLGFTPSEITTGWEKTRAEQEAVRYYRTWMEGILKQHNYAFVQEDREAVADARKRILEYNEQVPYPEMKIGSKTLKSSLGSYVESRAKADAGIESQKRFQRLRQGIEANYRDDISDTAQ